MRQGDTQPQYDFSWYMHEHTGDGIWWVGASKAMLVRMIVTRTRQMCRRRHTRLC